MAVFWQSLPLKPLEPLELFSLSLFGTEFVCKLMAASRSSGCKAAVMSPVGEVMSLREVMAAT